MTEALLLWGIGLLAASLLLIVVEVFVPSAGVITLVAAVLAIAGVVCLFRVSMAWGTAGSLAVLILGPTVFIFSMNILPSTKFGKRLIYGDNPPPDEPVEPQPDPLRALIGVEGVAVTDLRPVGTIRVNDQRYQAICEVSIVRAGAKIRVTAIDGAQIKVRPLA